MDALRIGKISSLNYKNGTARVLYTDRDNTVTVELPLLSFEYRMPRIDDYVLVCHMSNGAAAGVVIGSIWNDNRRPPEGAEGLYRKDLDWKPGICYLRYNAKTGNMEIISPHLYLSGQRGHDWDKLLDRVDELERRSEQHTHTDSVSGKTSTPHN